MRQPRPTLDIDRAAVVLIQRFGDDCALVAYRREQFCRTRGEWASAVQWRSILARVTALHFAPKATVLH